MIHAQIVDGSGNGKAVEVTSNKQLVVAPLSYDEAVFKELAEPNTAYNFYVPKPGKQFVITGVAAKADRDVSNTVDAQVVLYEASSEGSTTVDKTLFQGAMIRGEQAILLPLNIIVSEGKWLNAKTTDDDIHMTIMGYYVNKL